MATIGDILLQPETGWKRFDDTDNNISYTNLAGNYCGTGNYDAYYDKTYTQFIQGECNFNFTGTKLRIIGLLTPTSMYSNKIELSIDNKNVYYFFNLYSSVVYKALICNIENLDNKEHFATIKSLDGKMVNIDAIDINENGILKLYNENPVNNKYLIKQNDQYYTLKAENYSNGKFTPLTLAGGDKPNKSDYENFGFDDINMLCTNMTVGSETFRPIDKLNDEFDITMLKE